MDVVASPTSARAKETSRLPDPVEHQAGLLPSTHITVEQNRAVGEPSILSKPPLLTHVSTPAYSSPLRHHRRDPSAARQVKESLDARSEYITSQDDGVAEHRINQYVIKQEIGRGSFGAVHLAVDQFGTEYAVKEFSKARLRKRAQSHILRKPMAQRRRGALQGFNSPLHRMGVDAAQDDSGAESAINLIKEEIAIMKKLNHPNLVSLIEVLDDPSEDSLYMVMEMCKKGVVMKVDLEHQSDPYPDYQCRYWFRDLILGVEYLHAQGVVHRDIKPDNCLITNEDVLKVVDFGVSEMFEKDSEMKTAKSAGSPAFLPPELCVAKHGDVSGKAADIWSMGITLYCLKYGRIPFEKDQILELYRSIQHDEPNLDGDSDEDFKDLMSKILQKDPSKRITMQELRQHPWVTQRGADRLLSEQENTAHPVEPPTEEEMNAAITDNMQSLMTVVKAVKKFKALTTDGRPPIMSSILGDKSDARFTLPPGPIEKHDAPHLDHRSQSLSIDDRYPVEGALVAEGVHRQVGPKVSTPQASGQPRSEDSTGGADIRTAGSPAPFEENVTESDDELAELNGVDGMVAAAGSNRRFPPFRSHAHTTDDIGRRGHAHDPLEDQLFLRIGPSTFAGTSTASDTNSNFVPDDGDIFMVSESPGAADWDIYETAYREEIERILAKAEENNQEPQVYLTRRIDAKLLAISGRAGKLMAAGEEAKNQLKDYTQFSARRAKVTEVSRALREATKQEYERRKQERKAMYEAAKTEKIKPQSPREEPEMVDSPTATSPYQPANYPGGSGEGFMEFPSSRWKGKAADRSRQARTSLMGVLDKVKSKSKSDKF